MVLNHMSVVRVLSVSSAVVSFLKLAITIARRSVKHIGLSEDQLRTTSWYYFSLFKAYGSKYGQMRSKLLIKYAHC